MNAAERDYRRKLNQIAQKDSVLKLPDNRLPSFAERVQTTAQAGLKQMADKNSEHKKWIQQRAALNDDRIANIGRERVASIADMRTKAVAQRHQQKQRTIETLGGSCIFHGVPNGKPAFSRSASYPHMKSHLSTEEKDDLLNKLRNPFWEKPHKERVQMERSYMRWAAALDPPCKVDHKREEVKKATAVEEGN